MRVLVTIPIILFIVSAGYSTPPKWGKITKDEIALKECIFEKTAEAVVLSDYGRMSFNASDRISIVRHVRIKILKPGGIKNSDVRIPYQTLYDLEKVYNVRAQTINFQKGKKQTIKVEQSAIFDTDVSPDFREVRIVFPEVEVGSIIEYKYEITSRSILYLDAWVFQNEIPTLSSEFEAEIPPGLNYKVIFIGKRLITKYGQSNPLASWKLTSLPSLKDERFVRNKMDYAEKLNFQLSSYLRYSSGQAGTQEESVMQSWGQLAQEFKNSGLITNYTSRKNLAKDILQELSLPPDATSKVKSIYSYVIRQYHWNNNYRMFPDQGLSELVRSRQGSSAEINLLLHTLLKNADIQSDLVLIRTRSAGRITQVYPLLSQFNHILVLVRIGTRSFLMDATDPARPYNLLAIEDLNDLCYNISSRKWLEIRPSVGSRQTAFIKMKVGDNGVVNTDASVTLSEYFALGARKAPGPSDLVSVYLDFGNESFTIRDVRVEDYEDTEKPLKVTINADFELEEADGYMILDPFVFNWFDENPFKNENRIYPVEFEYPFKYTYVASVELPSDWSVVEIPQSALIKLPDDKGSFEFQVRSNENSIQISTNIKVNATFFDRKEYLSIRQFFDLINNRLNSPVLLRKVTD